MTVFFPSSGLTGGSSNALDGIDGDDISVGDIAYSFDSTMLYFHQAIATTLAESSPARVIPDANSSGKGWRQSSVYLPNNTPFYGSTGTALNQFVYSNTALADDGKVSLPSSKCGFGTIVAGKDYLDFRVGAASTIALVNNTSDSTTSDSDGNLCVYSSAGLKVKNRLGAVKNIRIIYWY